ncbi:MAG: UDP-3-O-acyl-N-acetylglucosamine deacetylase [Candidatus Eremiobacteraeota bacterium]|nr:UDP-3-O-acyl-N-acetylglucosamine deacetylase [Candidatus Eremiobacteraeota bacterium]
MRAARTAESTYQSTLRRDFTFEGAGLHTGVACRVDVLPGPVASGLRFTLNGQVSFPATADYVLETARATVLGHEGMSVSTVEHLLAALFGCGISNAQINVSGPEIPVVDGSAKAFADAIEQVGTLTQPQLRPRYQLNAPMFVRDGERSVIALPASAFRVKFVADFPAPVGTHYFDSEITPEVFREEICAARTFGYLNEVEALRKRGLAQGGSLENAVVFAPEGPMQPLRWPNEVVRHKVLDLLGDIALLGAWPQFEIIAIKSGHRLHCIATAELRRQNLANLPAAKVQ